MQAEITSKPHPPSLVWSLVSTHLSRLLRSDFDSWQLPVLEVYANLQHHSRVVSGTELHAQTEGGWSVVICEVNSAAVHLRTAESQNVKEEWKDGSGCRRIFKK